MPKVTASTTTKPAIGAIHHWAPRGIRVDRDEPARATPIQNRTPPTPRIIRFAPGENDG
jgi:hypothetical protein